MNDTIEPMDDAEVGLRRALLDSGDTYHVNLTIDEAQRLFARLDFERRRADEAEVRLAWRPMEAAPKDRPILAWCDHEADPYILEETPGGRTKLTLYAAHAEGLSHAPTGWHIVEWGGGFADGDEDGGAWLPDWWFVAGYEYEIAANPIVWFPLPDITTTTPETSS